MNIEKRTAASEPEISSPTQPPKKSGPVTIYIAILFSVAFLLIAYSILMQQHSQSETLGQLQNSVTAMQEVQGLQEKVIALQDREDVLEDQLKDANAALEDTKEQLENTQTQLEETELVQQALLGLYTLQQQFLVKDLNGCRETIAAMEEQGLVAHLPDKAMGLATAPSTRYLQLKEVIASL